VNEHSTTRQPFLVIAGDDDSSTGAAGMMLAEVCDLLVKQSAEDLLEDAELRRPDILLVDERAGTMSGLELVEALRERFSGYIPALLMTADPCGTREALLAGYEGVVTKPIDPERLETALRYVTPKKRTTAPTRLAQLAAVRTSWSSSPSPVRGCAACRPTATTTSRSTRRCTPR